VLQIGGSDQWGKINAFYQFWINTDDRDVPEYLRLFTFLDREEIEAVVQAGSARPQDRSGQRRLAAELSTLVHGEQETRRVEAASEALFGLGRGALEELDGPTLASALAEAPHCEVPPGELPSVTELLTRTGLATSRSDARRKVREGGVYLNNTRVERGDDPVPEDELLHGRYLVLRRGKKALAGVLRAG
jgi:tyrosyl-tRNA synthetase